MPNRVPIDEVEDYLAELISNARKGLAKASKDGCVEIRPGKFSVSLEVVWPAGDRVEEVTNTESQLPAGVEVTTTTEAPYSKTSVNVKTGSYTQAGTQEQAQGGGSHEETDNEYESDE